MKIINGIILLAGLVTDLAFSSSVIYGQQDLPRSRHYVLEKLSDGVFAAIHNNEGGYAICNAGIIDLGDKTVVLDPFMSPAAARDLRQHAEYLTGKPVSIVLNLDPHSDHTSGNQVFLPGAIIIGTTNTRNYIQGHFHEEYEYNRKNAPAELLEIQKQLKNASGKEKTELILWESEYEAIIESLPELKMTLPDVTINDTLVIYGSKRKLLVIPMGTGHTNADMVAFLPGEKIIFMSDELFVKCHPYLGDGDPESLKRNLEEIVKLDPLIAVPGHGQVGDKNSLNLMIDYIDTLTGLVRDEIRKGTDEVKIIEIPMPEKYGDYLISSLYKANLRFLYSRYK
jgi:glyoxylase-like metal-dependent hydrolase (beta-lactamase superfamily II)